MIQLKLKLNSKKPTTVYAANGKTYQLNPGSNVLNLEYEDYLSLAKALCIKPVDNKKQEEPENKEKKEDNPSEKQEVDLVNEGADYSAWSLKQLKSEYKKITGENCKLKKDDIISFLQERTSNA